MVYAPGDKIPSAWANALTALVGTRDSEFASYTIYTSGGLYYAKANFTGGTDYNGADFNTVLEAASNALGDTGTILVRRGAYASSVTTNLLHSYQTILFEPGFIFAYSGAGEAVKIGSNTVQVSRTQLIGNFAKITRVALGGTYGIHMENCHLCTVSGFAITKFATAPVLMEGCWGSWLERVEVENNPGTYGLILEKTQAGTYINDENNLVTLKECWLQGTVAAAWVQDNPQNVLFQSCDIHDSPTGIILDGGFLNRILGGYFEANTTLDINLRGTDNTVTQTEIQGNFFGVANARNIIYVDNALSVTVSLSQVEAVLPATTFVNTAGAGTRRIYIEKTRIGIPANVTMYGGDAGSLIYHDELHDTAGNAGCLTATIPMDSGVPLRWHSNVGAITNCLALEVTNILKLKNAAGTGDIQVSPQVSGGYILFFDDGVTYQMAKWTKDWSMPVVVLGADPGGLGVGDFGRMWYNTVGNVFKFYNNSAIRTLVSEDASGNMVLTGTLSLANNKYIIWKNTGGTDRSILALNGTNHFRITNVDGNIYLTPKTTTGIIELEADTTNVAGTLTATGLVTASAGLTVNAVTATLNAGFILGADGNLNSKYLDNWNSVGTCTLANVGYFKIKIGGAVKRVPYYDDA